MKLLAGFVFSTVYADVEIRTQLCGRLNENGKVKVMTAAEGFPNVPVKVFFNYLGDDVQEIKAEDMTRLDNIVWKAGIAEIETSVFEGINFDDIETATFEYKHGNILCLERLEIVDPNDESKMFKVIQDYDPNGWDTSLPENEPYLTWEPSRPVKQSYWTHKCRTDGRTASKYPPFEMACHSRVSFDFREKDECALGTHNCAPGAICTNTDKLYTCSCPEGFSGNPYNLAVGESVGCQQVGGLLKNVAGIDIGTLRDFGCACPMMVGKQQKGHPQTELDKACLAWRHCSECAGLGSCRDTGSAKYTTDEVAGVVSCDATEEGTCPRQQCECDLTLAKAFSSMSQEELNAIEPVDTCTKAPGNGFIMGCCPKGDSYKFFNEKTQKCCASGDVAGLSAEC